MTNAPGPWCKTTKRSALAVCVGVIGFSKKDTCRYGSLPTILNWPKAANVACERLTDDDIAHIHRRAAGTPDHRALFAPHAALSLSSAQRGDRRPSLGHTPEPQPDRRVPRARRSKFHGPFAAG